MNNKTYFKKLCVRYLNDRLHAHLRSIGYKSSDLRDALHVISSKEKKEKLLRKFIGDAKRIIK